MSASSLDVRQRAVAAVEAGMPVDVAARRFRLSRATINRSRKRLREAATLTPGSAPGRPRQIGPDAEPALAAHLDADPDATRAQHGRRWAEQWGVRVSVATMRRAVRRLGWTRKKSQWRSASATRRPARAGATMSSTST